MAPAIEATEATQTAKVSDENVAKLRESPASAARIAVVANAANMQELRALVVRIAERSEQSIATLHEPKARVAPRSECEEIWDQMTHMTRAEWAEACRRVDDEKRVGHR